MSSAEREVVQQPSLTGGGLALQRSDKPSKPPAIRLAIFSLTGGPILQSCHITRDGRRLRI